MKRWEQHVVYRKPERVWQTSHCPVAILVPVLQRFLINKIRLELSHVPKAMQSVFCVFFLGGGHTLYSGGVPPKEAFLHIRHCSLHDLKLPVRTAAVGRSWGEAARSSAMKAKMKIRLFLYAGGADGQQMHEMKSQSARPFLQSPLLIGCLQSGP